MLRLAALARGSPKKEAWQLAARALLILLVIALFGSGLKEFNATFSNVVANRPSASPRSGNIMEHPLTSDKVNSIRTLVPYVNVAGEIQRIDDIVNPTKRIPIVSLAKSAGDLATQIATGG